MITLIKKEKVDDKYMRCDFGCDTVGDIADLPTDASTLTSFGLPNILCATWSLAIVAADKSVYYKKDASTWVKVGG